MTHPVTIQTRRQAYLEWLYRQAGRDDPRHPAHGLYTGLLQLRCAELIDFDQRVALGDVQ
jgi:hypothetical protein